MGHAIIYIEVQYLGKIYTPWLNFLCSDKKGSRTFHSMDEQLLFIFTMG